MESAKLRRCSDHQVGLGRHLHLIDLHVLILVTPILIVRSDYCDVTGLKQTFRRKEVRRPGRGIEELELRNKIIVGMNN